MCLKDIINQCKVLSQKKIENKDKDEANNSNFNLKQDKQIDERNKNEDKLQHMESILQDDQQICKGHRHAYN